MHFCTVEPRSRLPGGHLAGSAVDSALRTTSAQAASPLYCDLISALNLSMHTAPAVVSVLGVAVEAWAGEWALGCWPAVAAAWRPASQRRRVARLAVAVSSQFKPNERQKEHSQSFSAGTGGRADPACLTLRQRPRCPRGAAN
jgi:hypothetical protein